VSQKNILKWGTGGINIGGCRIGEENIITNGFVTTFVGAINNHKPSSHVGRWPANILFEV
jgi:hypothetical protein